MKYETNQNIDSEYIPTKTARKFLGITTQTLRNWDSAGKIGTIRSPSGQRLYCVKDIYNIIGRVSDVKEKRKIAYCRVSSKKQSDDLERQKDFFKCKYPDYDLVTDIGSGINWKRQGFKTILEQAMSGDITEVMVAHRDRLCRFGFELIEWLFSKWNVKLIVLDREDNQSDTKDLADDIISIIHVFSCRQMGKRRYTKSKSKDLPIGFTEKGTEEMD